MTSWPHNSRWIALTPLAKYAHARLRENTFLLNAHEFYLQPESRFENIQNGHTKKMGPPQFAWPFPYGGRNCSSDKSANLDSASWPMTPSSLPRPPAFLPLAFAMRFHWKCAAQVCRPTPYAVCTRLVRNLDAFNGQTIRSINFILKKKKIKPLRT